MNLLKVCHVYYKEEKTNIHIDKARLFNNFFNSVFEEDQVVVSH